LYHPSTSTLPGPAAPEVGRFDAFAAIASDQSNVDNRIDVFGNQYDMRIDKGVGHGSPEMLAARPPAASVVACERGQIEMGIDV
jgi:hypothetical protein